MGIITTAGPFGLFHFFNSRNLLLGIFPFLFFLFNFATFFDVFLLLFIQIRPIRNYFFVFLFFFLLFLFQIFLAARRFFILFRMLVFTEWLCAGSGIFGLLFSLFNLFGLFWNNIENGTFGTLHKKVFVSYVPLPIGI